MSCTPSQTISTDTPGQVITGTVLDKAGKQGTASVTLKIDTTPPVVTLFTAPNQLSPGQSGTATLSATDNIGITSVVFSLNGTAISTLSGPPYTTNVTVPTTANPGDTLTLTATVSDAVGNAFSPSSHGILVVSLGVLVGQVLSDVTGLPCGQKTRMA